MDWLYFVNPIMYFVLFSLEISGDSSLNLNKKSLEIQFIAWRPA